MLQYDLEDKIFSVSEISDCVSNIFDDYFYSIKVRGEITNLKVAHNGHTYFSLKDNDALIDVICWKNTYQVKQDEIANGGFVVCSGSIRTYKKTSKYQLILSSLTTLEKEGMFSIQFQMLKEKLEKEGLFDQARRKKIKRVPEKIAILTSEKGAVLHDIMNRIKYRFPCKTSLYSIPVQDKNTHLKIIQILKEIDHLSYDAILIARGGGSFEDFHPFNQEDLIRFVKQLKTPIVSAIGHAEDKTLLDFAADLSAPTPSAAIEMLLPSKDALENLLVNLFVVSKQRITYTFEFVDLRIKSFSESKSKIDLKFNETKNHLTNLLLKIKNIIDIKINNFANQIDQIMINLENYNFERILELGFAVIKQGGVIKKSARELKSDMPIVVQFYDKEIKARILEDI
jgi:exodeoxyribonuclease VII large subunit